MAKLLQLSSNFLLSRVGPALYLLGALSSLLAPSVLDASISTKMTEGMGGMLVALYLLSCLASTLLTFSQYADLFFQPLEELDLVKLVKEAGQGRFEASAGDELPSVASV